MKRILFAFVIVAFGLAWITNTGGPDWDGDGLSDKLEKELGSDAYSVNTDGDRYIDGLDANPTVTNSADISTVESTQFVFLPQQLAIAETELKVSYEVPAELVLAYAIINFEIENKGTDYSSYLLYDIVVQDSKKRTVRTYTRELGRIDAGASHKDEFQLGIRYKDFYDESLEAIQKLDYTISIENVKYEQFTGEPSSG